MEQNKVQYGIIGILSLLVATMGGSIYLTPDQLANSYICSINQNVVLGVDHLSDTHKTAYWINDLGETESSVCRGGFWLDLQQYAKDNNLDLNILLQDKSEPLRTLPTQESGIKWECSPEGCKKIE